MNWVGLEPLLLYIARHRGDSSNLQTKGNSIFRNTIIYSTELARETLTEIKKKNDFARSFEEKRQD
jgi:hypothetical protein